MTAHYREFMQRFKMARRVVTPTPRGEILEVDIIRDEEFVHMMETVAPRIWMSTSFSDPVAQIFNKTVDNLLRKEREAVDQLEKTANAISNKERSHLARAFDRLALRILNFAGSRLTQDAADQTYVIADPDATKYRRSFLQRFDDFALPPYPKQWSDLPNSDDPNDVISVLIERNPVPFLPAGSLPVLHELQQDTEYRELFKIAADGLDRPVEANIRYRAAVIYDGVPMAYQINFVPGHGDVLVPWPSLGSDNAEYNEEMKMQERICRRTAYLLRTALLLSHARNSPFADMGDLEKDREVIGTKDQIVAFETRLARRNTHGRTTEKVIDFDMTSSTEKPPKSSQEKENFARELQRHAVGGHFNVNRTTNEDGTIKLNLVWISEHMRGMRNDGQTDDEIRARDALRRSRKHLVTHPGVVSDPAGNVLTHS